MNNERETTNDVSGARGEGGTNITGGTDKYGQGGLAAEPQPSGLGDTGVRETGDIMGATSTHTGAGGALKNTGGTGTAPTGEQSES